jgi:hypothetical protein
MGNFCKGSQLGQSKSKCDCSYAHSLMLAERALLWLRQVRWNALEQRRVRKIYVDPSAYAHDYIHQLSGV